MDVGVDDLKEIVKICVESELQTVYLEIGGVTLALSKSDAPLPFVGPEVSRAGSVRAPAAADPLAAAAAPAPPPAAPAPAASPVAEPAPPAAGLFEVKAPLLGVFYRRPAPGEPPFVEVGAEVAEDDAVCLIEVMKMFSRVPAGCRGRVAEICVTDGTMVEYGQTLIRIQPD